MAFKGSNCHWGGNKGPLVDLQAVLGTMDGGHRWRCNPQVGCMVVLGSRQLCVEGEICSFTRRRRGGVPK
eukprot:scaffold587_cov339-Pavlova_lutheri.AAC.44